jgi:Leucine-rich repeat (LRR) protein
MPKISCPSLKTLIMDENEINAVEFDGHKEITTLSMNKNKLTSGASIGEMPNLKTLLLAENEITSLTGMENMNNLKKLVLTGNKLENLETMPELPNL